MDLVHFVDVGQIIDCLLELLFLLFCLTTHFINLKLFIATLLHLNLSPHLKQHNINLLEVKLQDSPLLFLAHHKFLFDH